MKETLRSYANSIESIADLKIQSHYVIITNDSINEKYQIVEPEREQDDFNTTIKLPKLLAIKTILKPSYSEYNNITPIENKTIKPKKPSQEELLDDVLERILE